MSDDGLLDAYFDGHATPAEVAELSVRLATDPALARRFVELSRQEHHLHRIAGEAQLAPVRPPTNQVRRRPRPARSLASWALWLAPLAAVLALGTGLGWYLLRPDRAMVMAGAGVVATPAGDRRLEAGSVLDDGAEVAVAPGVRLSIGWRDGTRLRLDPASRMTLSGGKSMRLLSGGLQAEVAHQPADRPCAITTPQAQVTVVGTRFDLAIRDGSTSLEVAEGRVRFADLATGEHLLVGPGETARAGPPVPPAAPKTPSRTGLRLHLRADEGVVADGSGRVARWEDRSGSGLAAIQADAAARPSLVRLAGGRPVLRFSGEGQRLDFELGLEGLDGVTITLVSACHQDWSVPNPQHAAVYWEESALWGTVHLSPFQTHIVWRFGTRQLDNLPNYHPGDVRIGLGVVTMRKQGVTDQLYVDGRLAMTLDDRYPRIAGNLPQGHIGSGLPTPSEPKGSSFAGDIAELLVFDRALDEAERSALEARLLKDWDVSR